MAKGKYEKWLTQESLLIIQGWARDGLTDEQIAHNIGISKVTFYDWKKKYPNFSNAIKRSKEVADRGVSMQRDGKNIPGGCKNPRYANGNLRRKYRTRLKAMCAECGICHGRLGRIHYEEPSDSNHPLSFVIDEIKPISRYKEFGYASRREAAEDWCNIQAAHYICNARKRDKTTEELCKNIKNISIIDGNW